MFDLLGWKYEYEPFDLSGWIPDFVIYGADEVIVEVKPYSNLADFDIKKLERALAGTEQESKEILLLGSTVFENGDSFIGPAIGWLGEFCPTDEGNYWFASAYLNCNKHWGFFHGMGNYRDRVTGIYDGDHHLVLPSFLRVQKLWNQAGNMVQWKPPK